MSIKIPRILDDEAEALIKKWTQDLDSFTTLANQLPDYLASISDLLGTSHSEADIQAKLVPLLAQLRQSVTVLMQLNLAADQPLQIQYVHLLTAAEWLNSVIRSTRATSIEREDLRELHTQLLALSASASRLTETIPPGSSSLAGPLHSRSLWLDKRINVVKGFIDAANSLAAAPAFRASLRSPFSKLRERLDTLDGLSESEEKSRNQLRERIDAKEKDQFVNALAMLVVLLFVLGGGSWFASRLMNGGDGVIAAAPPTNTPFIITATPEPTATPTITLTPTLTPTPTNTPTPTPTPEVVAQCVSNGQRWIFSEPGHTQDESDREFRAGYVNDGEVIGVLRDIPSQAVEGEWVKIKIVRGEAESRGWVLRAWIDCP